MTLDQDDSKRVGSEHLDEVGEGYHQRLAQTWPEPRDQLHHGGWNATYRLVDLLGLASADYALDLCCGEGGTALWLAEQYGHHVAGVDLAHSATVYARQQRTPGLSATFATANAFDLPFAAEQFEVIYGQDPDGLAHRDRVHIFNECRRVLRPLGRMGFQHWVLHDEAPPEWVERYEGINAEVGFASMSRLRISDYLHDMHQAGFQDVQVIDMGDIYHKHMLGIEQIVNAREPGSLDRWTQLVLDIFDAGYKIGALFLTSK